MKRILFLQRDPYPMHQPDVTVLFGKYLPHSGIHTDLVSVTYGEQTVSSSWNGGALLLAHIPSRNILGRLTRLVHCTRCMVKHVRTSDVIQVRNDALLGLIAALIARLYSKKFYFWMSFPYPESDRVRAREQFLALGLPRLTYVFLRGYLSYFLQYRIVMRLAHFCFVQSETMRYELAKKGLRAQQMQSVPMGVDFDELSSFLQGRDHQSQHNSLCISYLGALDKVRRPDLICDVLLIVRKTFPKARLLLIGDAKETADKEWLLQRIAELGLTDAVDISGWVDRRQAWALAQSSRVSICALPQGYIFQSMSPTKLVELLALKVPVVATPQPEHEELLGNGERGLIASADAESLAKTVVQVFSDPERAFHRAEAGYTYVCARRAYDVIAMDLARVYQKLQPGAQHD